MHNVCQTFLTTTIQTPSSGRRNAPSDEKCLPHAQVKQEERIPAPNFANSTTLPTPESVGPVFLSAFKYSV